MLSNAKALLAKSWKNEIADLPVGRHAIDETLLVRVRGEIEKHDDQMIAPTVSIPLVSVLAYFWERAGLERDAAMSMLREAIHEAMTNGQNENAAVLNRIEDVETAIKSVKADLIATLPKMPRAGRLDTKNLSIDVLALSAEDEPLAVEAA
jgi:acyl carrier protein phosphodiesterase